MRAKPAALEPSQRTHSAAPAGRAVAFFERHDRSFVLALAALYAAAFSFLCIRKFDHYLYNDFDLAIFAQAMDQMLHGSFFNSIRGMNWLGDHSSLILFPLLPLYAIARHPITLLVVQSVVLALGAVPVRWLARRETGSGALAAGCAALYLLYPALGYTNLFEFHPEAISTTALLFAFYYLRASRTVPLAMWASIALLGKEDVALVVGGMALYALAHRADPRRFEHAGWLAALAALSAAVTVFVLQPLNAGQAEYGAMYRQWGANGREIVRNMVSNPWLVVQQLFMTTASPFDSLLKREYYLHLLLPVGFLSLASPLTLLIAAPMVAVHLLSWRPEQHSIVFHYTALVTPFVIAAAVMGLARIAGVGAPPVRLRRSRRRRRRRSGEAEHAPSPESEPTPSREPAHELAGATGESLRHRARTATAPARRAPRGAAYAVIALALGFALVTQFMFGPVLGSRRWQTMKPRQTVTPSLLDRTSKPHRDALVAGVPKQGAVVAGFEFLSHLTHARELHSLHHILLGTYTFSSRPYPIPTAVTALVAEAGLTGTSYASLASATRLRELRAVNRLATVEQHGTLLLMLRNASDTVAVARAGDSLHARRRWITFDGGLEFVSHDAPPDSAMAGDEVVVTCDWRRSRSLDRLYAMSPRLKPPRGGEIELPAVNLASMFDPAHEWHQGRRVRVTARVLLPLDLEPGRHVLGFRTLWLASDGEIGVAVANNPVIGAGVIELGAIEITAPGP